MFRSYLGIVFGFKKLTFMCIFSSKGWYMISKIKIWSQILALWEGHLTIFKVKQAVFRGFWKLVWSCTEVVWTLFWALKGILSFATKCSRTIPLLWGPAVSPTTIENRRFLIGFKKFSPRRSMFFFFYCVGGGGYLPFYIFDHVGTIFF